MYSRTTSRKRSIIILFVVIIGLFATAYYRNQKESVVNQSQNLLLAVVAPIQKGVNAVISPFRRAGDYVVFQIELIADNRDLRAANGQLIHRVRELKKYESENKRLRVLADFRRKTPFKTTAARVVSQSPSSWQSLFTIDTGSKGGIKKGMAVISDKGLVGKVTKVTARASLVQLIDDRHSGVAVELGKTGATAVVEGSIDRSLKLRFLPDDEKIVVGEKVLTSGKGGIFPRGLLVGRVAKISKSVYSIEKLITIKSPVNFKRVSEVLIITTTPVGKDLQ